MIIFCLVLVITIPSLHSIWAWVIDPSFQLYCQDLQSVFTLFVSRCSRCLTFDYVSFARNAYLRSSSPIHSIRITKISNKYFPTVATELIIEIWLKRKKKNARSHRSKKKKKYGQEAKLRAYALSFPTQCSACSNRLYSRHSKLKRFTYLKRQWMKLLNLNNVREVIVALVSIS